jgi:hypothetical protein
VDERDVLPIGLNWHKTHEVAVTSPPMPEFSVDHSLHLSAYEELLEALESSPDSEAVLEMRMMLRKAISIAKHQSIPEKMAVFQNYPNPFNPETWIPYQLSRDAQVEIVIYNSSGQMVRRLELGYKSAGTYVGRDFAAYWDGRNDAGENLASGTYFYKIQAGDFAAVRKMILVK